MGTLYRARSADAYALAALFSSAMWRGDAAAGPASGEELRRKAHRHVTRRAERWVREDWLVRSEGFQIEECQVDGF